MLKSYQMKCYYRSWSKLQKATDRAIEIGGTAVAMSALSKVDQKHKDLVQMSYKMMRDGLCNSIGDGKKMYVVHCVLLSVLYTEQDPCDTMREVL